MVKTYLAYLPQDVSTLTSFITIITFLTNITAFLSPQIKLKDLITIDNLKKQVPLAGLPVLLNYTSFS